MGRGRDTTGEFFRFYENATGSGGTFGQSGRQGVALSNKFYRNADGTWSGNSIWHDNLTITMVRPNTNQDAPDN